MYADTLNNGTSESIIFERSKYREIVGEWSEQRPVLLMEIRVVYDYNTAIGLEEKIQEPFSIIDHTLRRVRVEFETTGLRNEQLLLEVEERSSQMNAVAQDLMAALLKISEINKAIFEQRPVICNTNFDDLTSLYLFKSLFKPRQYS